MYQLHKMMPGHGNQNSVGIFEETADMASSSSCQQTTFDLAQGAHWALSVLDSLDATSTEQNCPTELASSTRTQHRVPDESDVFQRNETAESTAADGTGTAGPSQSTGRRRHPAARFIGRQREMAHHQFERSRSGHRPVEISFGTSSGPSLSLHEAG
jgi:hypothetical protein